MHPSVTLQTIGQGIVQMTMEDRETRNAFSPRLVQDLVHAFEDVGRRDDCKVVVLTGYDSFFSTGGTREGLLALQSGRGTFADTNIYSLPLECPVPVISAVQGHALGGGFVLGLYADFVLLSRESVYTTNFMEYGFTPGMGATLVVPMKLGTALGHEMLLAAQTYRGQELKDRGVPFAVYPRDQVLDKAIEMARRLADKPRLSLVTLKEHLTATLRRELPTVVAQEVVMHEKTFRQAGVRERIEKLLA